MRRCYRDKGYEGRSPKKAYKKAGVTVCDEWKDYFRFKKWALANGYDEERSNGENVAMRMCPGRIGDKGNFEPGNFEWITLNEEIRRWNHQSKWKRELDDLNLDARCTLDDNDPVSLDTRSQAAFEESRRDRRYRLIPVVISVISVFLALASALIALGALQLSSIEIFGRPLSFLEILGLFPK